MMATSDTDISTMFLAEFDTLSNFELCVWTYPDFRQDYITTCINTARCLSLNHSFGSVLFFKIQSDWIYLIVLPNLMMKDISKSESNYHMLCIAVKYFHPQKYTSLLKVLFGQYILNHDPTKLLAAYLSIHATGKFSNTSDFIFSDQTDNHTFHEFQLNVFNNNDLISPSIVYATIEDIAMKFGEDIIVIWNAIVLKKRIIVYSDSIKLLQDVIPTLIFMVKHRNNFDIMRPIISTAPIFLTDLTSAGVYIAGTIESSTLRHYEDICDIMISLVEMKVNIMNHALCGMKMCNIHKELSIQIDEIISDRGLINDSSKGTVPSKGQQILQCMNTKLENEIYLLKSFIPGNCGKLTEQIILDSETSKTSNNSLKLWLCRLATAEGLI